MALPEHRKKYLIVACKGCGNGIRVIKEPLFEGKEHEVRGPVSLTCKGCGHTASYNTSEMTIAAFGRVITK